MIRHEIRKRRIEVSQPPGPSYHKNMQGIDQAPQLVPDRGAHLHRKRRIEVRQLPGPSCHKNMQGVEQAPHLVPGQGPYDRKRRIDVRQLPGTLYHKKMRGEQKIVNGPPPCCALQWPTIQNHGMMTVRLSCKYELARTAGYLSR